MANKFRALKRSEFVDGEAYADALMAAGGPEYGRINELTHLVGESAEIMRAVWGGSQGAYNAAVAAETQAEQRARQHIFVRTRGARRSKGGKKKTG